jgi:hypothetical protein
LTGIPLTRYAAIQHIPFSLFIILECLILSEWINQICKAILQLQFKSKIVAICESISIMGYVISVWSYYFIYGTLTLSILFTPLLIVSLIGIVILGHQLLLYYRRLPLHHTDETISKNLISRMARSRFLVFFNQIIHSTFSSNFLVPFFAINFSLADAGALKMAASISNLLTTLFHHIFGATSNAVLAQIKNESMQVKQTVFAYMTRRINSVIYGILIFMFINTKTIINMGTNNIIAPKALFYIILFLFLSLSDNILIAYEKLFIAEEKIRYFIVLNIISMLFVYSILNSTIYFSQFLVLALLILARLIIFVFVKIISYYIWGLKPFLDYSPNHLTSYSTLLIFLYTFFAS